MKGISLAIETIIFVILAVIVLTVLLLFFTGTAGEAEDRIKLEQERTRLCEQYVQADRACNDPAALSGFGDRSKLGDTCSKLNIIGCSSSPELECVQRCCIFCTTRP